jgi:hypothetical protein
MSRYYIFFFLTNERISKYIFAHASQNSQILNFTQFLNVFLLFVHFSLVKDKKKMKRQGKQE